MPSLRLVLALAAALLVGASSAHAAAEAPGALKKQAEETAEAIAAPAQPVAPQQPVAPAPTVKSEPKVTERAPVSKGSERKQASTNAGSGTGSAPQTASTPVRTTGRTTRRTTRRASTRSSSRSRGPARRTRRAGSRAGAAGLPATTPATAAPAPAGATAPAAAPRRASDRRKRSGARTASASEADEKKPSGIGQIENAADAVVEVIPGTIVLALAGMSALVLMLIFRSWLMERRRSAALEASYGVTVEALATAIEAKDQTTGGHIERVRRLGLLLAREIVPREARDPQMAYGFLLHDIGKVAVPDAILRAPGKLSDEDWLLMRRHPEEGVRMLAHVPFLDRALDVVRHHHERWDGSGYPDGLSGEQIPLWARIFAVADALDAMTADRPYCARRTFEAAVDEIRRNAGTQFDPRVVEALVALDPELVKPLLEPAQVLDREPLAELPEPRPPAPLVPA